MPLAIRTCAVERRSNIESIGIPAFLREWSAYIRRLAEDRARWKKEGLNLPVNVVPTGYEQRDFASELLEFLKPLMTIIRTTVIDALTPLLQQVPDAPLLFHIRSPMHLERVNQIAAGFQAGDLLRLCVDREYLPKGVSLRGSIDSSLLDWSDACRFVALSADFTFNELGKDACAAAIANVLSRNLDGREIALSLVEFAVLQLHFGSVIAIADTFGDSATVQSLESLSESAMETQEQTMKRAAQKRRKGWFG